VRICVSSANRPRVLAAVEEVTSKGDNAMFTSARRIMGPAIGILLLLGAVAHPAFGQSYTPSPSSVTVDIDQGQDGSGTQTSATMGGLPSVSCNGGATVTFDFGSTWQIYHGGGSAYVQYKSDLMPDWTTIATQTASESTSLGPSLYSPGTVSVSNLSSLNFRISINAGTGQGGYVIGSATLDNVSVHPN
jgi:hypothetical protein